MKLYETSRRDLRRINALKALATTAALLALAVSASAAVVCPPIFSDHMVLQRDQPVAVWGTADPHEKVTVTFAGQEAKATASTDGNWKLTLPPLAASFESRTLTVRGENTITFQDVLVGEVWLCSGQSNMDKPLGEKRGQQPTLGYPEVLAEGDLPHLRLFRVPNNVKIENPALESTWVPCSSEILDPMQFSAAGFHFGQKLLEELNIPIGLIHSAFGGTMIEAWMPESAFHSNPQLEPLLERPYFAWIEGVQATELYESMIAPLVPYTLRGFLWYQGESNLMHGDGEIYALKMKSLIEAWRENWSTPDAPFYFAQIAPFTYSEWIGHKSLTLDGLPLFWEAQLSVADPSANIEIIPTIDLVDDVRDIHPTNKKDVGLRFAQLALSKTYELAPFIFEMPRLKSSRQGPQHTLILEFTTPLYASRTIEAKALGSFEIAGQDGRFRTAQSTWKNGYVELSHPDISLPIYARYAWDEKASPPRTTGKLPLYPFRTDKKKLAVLTPQFHKAKRFDISPQATAEAKDTQRWHRWPIESGPSQHLSFENLNLSLHSLGKSKLIGTKKEDDSLGWAKVVSDGIISEGGEPIKLSISGLSDGPHSIVTYHNRLSGKPSSKTNIIHENRVIGQVSPDKHLDNEETPFTFYYEFEITNGDLFELVFSPANQGDGRGIILSAFAIDVPNPNQRAHTPSPIDGSQHSDFSSETIDLKWEPNGDTESFRVYLYGSESAEDSYKLVSRAGRSSRSFRGETSENSLSITPRESSDSKYYAWRVDSIDREGKLTRGEVWTFTTKIN